MGRIKQEMSKDGKKEISLKSQRVLVEFNKITGDYAKAVPGVRKDNCTYTYMAEVPVKIPSGKVVPEIKSFKSKKDDGGK